MQLVLRVAVPVPVPRLFDYLAPEGSLPTDPIGCRVVVAFGRRQLVGVVVDCLHGDIDVRALRVVERWLDRHSLFGQELLASLRWAASYYAHPLGEVLGTALPVALRAVKPRRLPQQRWLQLSISGRAALLDNPPRGGSAAAAIVDLLGECAGEEEVLAHCAGNARRALRDLCARGWLEAADPPPLMAHPQPGPTLNPAQAAAAEAIIAQRGFAAIVVDGVTGSGKTEVYLAAIAQVLSRGEQALVLVPEIGLTPQALQRYRERLGVPVLALHSGLADGERAAAWLAAARGEVAVVLGTRSAVFTPLARPGLIVVDEEHDLSYKQLDGFRYHARDLAVVRARALNVPVVMGSATPALETLANAQSGRYQHLRLAQRAGNAKTPGVDLIDVRKGRMHEGLSIAALDAIASTVARGEQVLVFRNRRGFSPVLLCHGCGWHAECPRCDRPLTLHGGSAMLRCHHCGAATARPKRCPACQDSQLLPLGAGTERIEAALCERFPTIKVLRVDRDTTRRRGAFESMLQGLATDQPAILVGTQMLAKGHDLPNLTLAVLVDVDGGLFSADFRGPERLAQLIVQVAGRAGRADKPGRVLLQTHHPQHEQLRELLVGGYHGFAKRELGERQALGFPPYAHLVLLRAEAPTQAALDAFLGAARALFDGQPEIAVRGPLPAPMPRRAGMLRAQLLLESPRRAPLHAALASQLDALHQLREGRRVRWSLDVDPVELS